MATRILSPENLSRRARESSRRIPYPCGSRRRQLAGLGGAINQDGLAPPDAPVLAGMSVFVRCPPDPDAPSVRAAQEPAVADLLADRRLAGRCSVHYPRCRCAGVGLAAHAGFDAAACDDTQHCSGRSLSGCPSGRCADPDGPPGARGREGHLPNRRAQPGAGLCGTGRPGGGRGPPLSPERDAVGGHGHKSVGPIDFFGCGAFPYEPMPPSDYAIVKVLIVMLCRK